MTPSQQNRPSSAAVSQEQWEGALVDDRGREVPITDSMISAACEKLAESFSIGVSSENPAPEDR